MTAYSVAYEPYGNVIYHCLLPGCEWTFKPGEPTPEQAAIAEGAHEPSTGLTGHEALARIAVAVDRVLEGHLSTHTLLEWVQEIGRLNRTLAKVGAPTGPVIEVDRSDLAELLAKVPHEGTAWERLADRMLSTSRT